MKSTITFVKLIACSCLVAACASSALADITKATTGTDLTVGASWIGGTAPGATDNALWSGSSLGPGLTMGANETWLGIGVSGASGDIDISGAGVLTNGNITVAGNNLTLNNTNALLANGTPAWTWTVAAGKTLTANGPVLGTNVLILAGPGTVVLTNALTGHYTGGNYVGGTILSNSVTAIFVDDFPRGYIGLTNSATLIYSNRASGDNSVLDGGIIIGSGTIIKQGPTGRRSFRRQMMSWLRLNRTGTAVAMVAGSLIDVENGAIRNDNSDNAWHTNYASAYVGPNGLLDAWDGYMQVDALNGYGTISKGWSSTANFAMGAANGSGTFFGIISNNFNLASYGGAAGGTLNVFKLGTGTQTLEGTNTYVGSTTVSNGTLAIGGAGMLMAAANNTTTPTTYAGAIVLVATTSIFNYASSQNQILGGAVSGPGSFTVSGSGSVTNTGAYAAGGNTTVSGAGSLVLTTTAALTLGNVNVTGSGTLQLIGPPSVITLVGNLNATPVISPGVITLNVGSTNAGTGSITLIDGYTVNMTVLGATQWSPASLTLGTSTGGTLSFNGVTNSGTATAPINAASFARNGTMIVNVNSTADPNIAVGSSYPLVSHWGANSGYTLGTQPVGWIGHLDASSGTLKYVVDLQYDLWSNASGNNLWDIATSPNWVGHAVLNADKYLNGDSALFGDANVTSNQVITVSGALAPAAVEGANNTYKYEVDSTAGNSIGGTGGLTMIGTNNLTLTGGVNTYSGATTINAGTVTAGVLANHNAPSDIGQPNSTDPSFLMLNGGTLNYMGGTVAIDRGVTVGPNNGTLSVSNSASTVTMNGLITGPGLFAKSGGGTMILPNANTHTGGTTIGAGGKVVIGTIAALGTGTNVNVNGILDLNGQSLPSADIVLMGNGSMLTNSGGPVRNQGVIAVTAGNNITLAGSSNMTNDWMNRAGGAAWTVTNNITGTVVLDGTNDNSGMVFINNGGGTVLLDKTLTNSGCANSIWVYNGLVKIAYYNPWTPGYNSGGQFYTGGTLLINGGAFDMNGASQVTANLQSTAAFNGGGVLTNSGGVLSTLILTGNSGGPYTNTIMEGPTSPISIVKTNGGTQTIGGTNKFTGGLAVVGTTAGTLNYGYGETNSPIFNYPVTMNIGTLNFNVSGTYYWNDSTMSGTAGTFGLNNNNMTMWLTNNYLFGGNIVVTHGTLHMVATYAGSGSAQIGGGINVANTAYFIADLTGGNNPAIGGSLTFGTTSTNIINYDNSNSYLQVGGGINCGSATLKINVQGSALAIGTYTLMTGTNCVGSFNSNPDFSGGLGLAGPTLGAYIATSASGTVSLIVYQAYVWYGPDGNNFNWSDSLNWNIPPNQAGRIATLSTLGQAPYNTRYEAITLDVPETIGGILFANANSFGVVGGQTLTLNNNGNGAPLNVSLGTTNLISVPVALADSSGQLGVNVSGGAGLTMSGTISGNSALSMAGGGTLTLSGANTFTGPVSINGGILKIGNSSALGTFPTNTINSGGTLDLNGQTLNQNAGYASGTATNVIYMPGGGLLINSSASQAVVHSSIVSPNAGGTAFTIGGTGPIAIDWATGPGYPNWYFTNNDTGTVDLDGTNDFTGGIPVNRAGTLLLDVKGTTSTPGELHAASSLIVLGGLVKWTGTGGGQIWTGGTLTLTGGTVDLNGQGQRDAGFNSAGSGLGVLTNSMAGTMATLTNNGGTFYGTVVGNISLIYTASSTLGGTNLFWGGLAVTTGTLTVSNALTAAGTASTNLPVNVASGAVLNLLAGVTNQIQSLSLGGTGQAAGLYTSANASPYITGPGALQVLSGPTGPTGPALLTNSVAGNVLSLSWPAGQGWRLVSQTNSLATGLNPSNAAWGTVPGVSDGSATITITRTNPAVFYKLIYP